MIKLKKLLSSLALLSALLSSHVIADSDIYVTNNTKASLLINIEHTGSDLLEKNDEWFQHAHELGPYETKKVLSFNRYYGAKSGKEYRFNTQLITGSGDQVSLLQNMRGTWFGSTVTHSAKASDFDAPQFSDREIQRFNSYFNSVVSTPTEVAFKAAATARYDDFYYTITEQQLDEIPAEPENALKVMTYNIWALPVIASHISERLGLLPEYLKGYDAILLQEVFSSGRDDFLRVLAREYPYQTRMLDKPGINIYDGGVTIISRYPIVNQTQYVFPDCSGTDCFADKGVNYAEIIKEGQAYHLFATHTASFDTDSARANRQTQFRQIRNLAQNLNIPQSEMVVYGGDFNVNKRKFPIDYQNMLSNLQASEPSYAGYTESTFDPRINSFAGQPGSGGENVEYLDYIVVSNEYKSVESNTNTVKVPRTTAEPLWKHWDLSDHFPVKAEINQ